MHVKGTPKTPGSGRKKGTPNRNSVPVKEMCDKLGISPAQVLAYFAAGDWKSLGYKSETYIVEAKDYSNEKLYIEPSIRMKAASELCRYLYPTLKSITVTKDPHDIPTDCEDMTDEELDQA